MLSYKDVTAYLCQLKWNDYFCIVLTSVMSDLLSVPEKGPLRCVCVCVRACVCLFDEWYSWLL